MSFFDDIAPIKQRVFLMIGRGAVLLSDAAKKMQTLQLKVRGDATDDDLEHFEPYGFTSRPKDPDATGQAEAVFVSIGGNNDHQIAIVVGDRRYRLKDLEKGEVALFDDQGAFVKLSSAGIIVEPAAGQNVELGAGATKGVAREGDAVSVTIPAGSFLTAATSGVLNPAPVTVSGTIQAGSLIVKASD